eukprot:1147280-Pelagomonas_calceolata.AAC.4
MCAHARQLGSCAAGSAQYNSFSIVYARKSHCAPFSLTVCPSVSLYALQFHCMPFDLIVRPSVSLYALQSHCCVGPSVSLYALQSHYST